jgi:hypothetical protein
VNQTNNGYFTGMTGNPPLVTPLSGTASGTAASNINLANAVGNAAGTALNPAFTDPNWMPARMQSWNTNVEREIGSMGVMVGYFGSHGDRLSVPINPNQFTVPGGTTRPYPRVSLASPIVPGATLNNIAERVSLGWSNYNALWVTANHRMAHGLQISGSYTLAKSMDTNSGDGTMSQQDSTNLAESYALSDFDVRHRVSFQAAYELPFKGNRLVEGWQINVVEQAQTGGPFNITTNIATITGSTTVRPDLIGALPPLVLQPVLDTVTGAVTSYQWFNGQGVVVCDPRTSAPANQQCNSTSVFALPYNAAGVAHFGNLARNAMIGPGFGNTDLSFIKNLKLAGAAHAQFRIEVFNLFNQANLNLPGRTASPLSTSFGVISSTRFPTGDSGSSRQVQFAAKFLF